MASSFASNALISASVMLLFFASRALGGITCENLDRHECAFAVSSSGTRCVLEKRLTRGGLEKYTCRASEIEAGASADWIETNECVEACGADRGSVGISSDFIWDAEFIHKLCSDACYKNCPNIVDLYFNLALGEGVFLPQLCGRQQKASVRRNMLENRSNLGEVVLAPGPVAASSGRLLASAPTMSLDLVASSPAAM